MIVSDTITAVCQDHHHGPGAETEGKAVTVHTVPNEDITRLLRYIIAMEGELCQIYQAADAHAEAASSLSRFLSTDITLRQVADYLAGAEIMRHQLCLMLPELPSLLKEAYADKIRDLMISSEYPYAIEQS